MRGRTWGWISSFCIPDFYLCFGLWRESQTKARKFVFPLSTGCSSANRLIEWTVLKRRKCSLCWWKMKQSWSIWGPGLLSLQSMRWVAFPWAPSEYVMFRNAPILSKCKLLFNILTKGHAVGWDFFFNLNIAYLYFLKHIWGLKTCGLCLHSHGKIFLWCGQCH